MVLDIDMGKFYIYIYIYDPGSRVCGPLPPLPPWYTPWGWFASQAYMIFPLP